MWLSPSKGLLDFDEMIESIKEELAAGNHDNYRLMIGCDSHTRGRTTYVTAIILHRIGKGAKFFYHKHTERKVSSLTQKIFTEATFSLAVANQVAEKLGSNVVPSGIEIHVDMGKKGETRKLIKEVVGMVVGSGYPCLIKPKSIAATWCADRFSKVEGGMNTCIQ